MENARHTLGAEQHDGLALACAKARAEVERLTRERDDAVHGRAEERLMREAGVKAHDAMIASERVRANAVEAERDDWKRMAGTVAVALRAAEAERDALRARAERAEGALSVRFALAREVEALLGVPSGPAGPEQLEAGVAAVRALVARAEAAERERDAARTELDAFIEEGTPDLVQHLQTRMLRAECALVGLRDAADGMSDRVISSRATSMTQ